VLVKRAKVVCNRDNMPVQINNLKVQQVLEYWKDTGCWWAGEKEKSFCRVLCVDGGVYEIYLDHERQEWYLYKTYD
jgi:hypothetical protein